MRRAVIGPRTPQAQHFELDDKLAEKLQYFAWLSAMAQGQVEGLLPYEVEETPKLFVPIIREEAPLQLGPEEQRRGWTQSVRVLAATGGGKGGGGSSQNHRAGEGLPESPLHSLSVTPIPGRNPRGGGGGTDGADFEEALRRQLLDLLYDRCADDAQLLNLGSSSSSSASGSHDSAGPTPKSRRRLRNVRVMATQTD
jgi:hypothetical protein